MIQIAKYGWLKDRPDFRDFQFEIPHQISAVALPPEVNLTSIMPAPFDQGQIGSCTGNAWSGAALYAAIKNGLPDHLTPSRLFIYFNERAIEGTTSSDSGAQLRDGANALASKGWCDETLWPYNVAKFATKPPSACYGIAYHNKATKYASVRQDLNTLKATLFSGFPIPFGFTVYSSFETQQVADTGIVPLPKASESVLGGHAVLLMGYNDGRNAFLVRNSWGTSWGLGGYFWMPYSYVTNPNLASDFWVLTQEG